MIWFILILLSIPLLLFLIGAMLSGPKYKGIITDHFDGERFVNPGGVKAKGIKEVLKWMLQRQRGKWDVNPATPGPRPLKFVKDGIRVTFVNHSTFLIQVDGLNILTDPIWSKRTSPFSWAGPKRMREPGIKFEDLPRIHVVLLSHNHYDHLDLTTMRMLQAAHHPKIVTPLGVKAFLDNEQIKGATDLDWWDEAPLSESVHVQAVPAQHFSGRGSLDRDATLWCGYLIETSFGKIYFAGDTGYNESTFKEVGDRAGDIKVSIIPIGAYKPSWFMSPIHTNPDEALKIHLDVRSQLSIGSHFGTFPLADDAQDDPVNDLMIALEKHHLTSDNFVLLKEGEPRDFN